MPRKPIGFDYSSVSSDVRDRLQDHSRAITQHMAGTTKAMVDIGRRLTEVRQILEPSTFLSWIKYEFEWEKSMAYLYMRAAERMGHLDCLEQFRPTALTLLSNDNTPLAARKEAIQIARGGNKVTRKLAEELVRKHRPQPAAGGATGHGPTRNIMAVVGTLRSSVDEIVEALSEIEREALAESLIDAANRIEASTQAEYSTEPQLASA